MKRTGIKILFWKLLDYLEYPYKLVPDKEELFPRFGNSYLKIYLWLYTLKNEIKEWKMNKKLGFLHCHPHPLAVNVWRSLISLNPNNMGSWTQTGEENLRGTMKAEKNLIMSMIDLLGGNKKGWTGYVTSGASEANLFAAWTGRNYLKEMSPKGTICMIINPLTHYSVKKAADITGIQCIEMGIDHNIWTINPDVIRDKIKDLYNKGYTSFLVPLTLGYTQTGANDNYKEITNILLNLQKKIGIKCFIWLDAAINGLILPFTESNFFPLKAPGINLIALDFHKTGMCPIPSGIVLYRENFKKYISRKVAYLDQDDSTISGSRSGIAAAACLAIIKKLGKDGFKRLIGKTLVKKNKFIELIESLNLDMEIFSEEKSLALALICKKPLSDIFINKFGIYAKKWKYKFDQKSESLYIYKINFALKI